MLSDTKPNGHADPFGELMTRRVRPVPLTFRYTGPDGEEIERVFAFELREPTYGEAKPLLAQAETMDGTEFGQRLIGMAVYLDGVQLGYERVLKMTPATIGKLNELVPAIIEVFGLPAPKPDEETADEGEGVGVSPAAAASLPPDAGGGTAADSREKKD